MIRLDPVKFLQIFVASFRHRLLHYTGVGWFVYNNPHMFTLGIQCVKLLTLLEQLICSDLVIIREKVVVIARVIIKGSCEDDMMNLFFRVCLYWFLKMGFGRPKIYTSKRRQQHIYYNDKQAY